SKNSSLPILAAAILCDEPIKLYNCPDISDVDKMLGILKHTGAKINKDKNTVEIDCSNARNHEMPQKFSKEIRSSIFMLGSVVSRFKKAKFIYPGGCEIGSRPIDLHLKGLRELNITITEEDDEIFCVSDEIRGARIFLDYPSVGATENIIMAAVLANGHTIIGNAACEPEIVDLSNMLSAMGAKIKGAGTNVIRITGVKKLNPARHTVIPDRIEAGSFMVVAAATKGELIITNVITEHIKSIIAKLQEAGVTVEEGYDGVHVIGNRRLLPVDLKTMPYPGFPTDMQAQFMALLTLAGGASVITETVFENRFRHAGELKKMCADIKTNGHSAVINGIKRLRGAAVEATDLRAGAAMIVAALAAEGVTSIGNVHHIERGYENICGKLAAVGAGIKVVEE
ncbi:MAG: UDP-N-acetylglucosamine 1-carboxyvinyltransferase, partial [Clostridiales bacterium]|nr:UDP-N-acetylglucosamine 1-carboxyvinyltransferase [Clostridiales bacterium]